MQNLDPKDRPKLIGISVLFAIVVIIGVKTTMDTINSVAPIANAATPLPLPSASPAAGAAGVAGTAPDGTTTDSNAFSLDRFPFIARSGRDPFAPVADDKLAQASIVVPGLAPAAVVTPAPPATTGVPNVPLDKRLVPLVRGGQVPDNITNEIKNVGEPVAPPKPIVRVLPPAPPPYNVIGVVISEPAGRDVAILQRTAGTDKKFVVVGDPLDGGYTVTGIESGGVRVKHPGHAPVTSAIPGVAQTQVPGSSTEYFLPRQTIVVPATSMTLPLGETQAPGTPGAANAQSSAPRAK